MPLFSKDGKDLLFIHIPKCGGTSLENIFSPVLKMSLFHDGPGEFHCSPQHFHASFLENLFDYRMPPSLAVVRNPLDRLVSEYRYLLQNALIPTIDFDQFVNNSFGEYWKNNYVHDNHIRAQVEFIAVDTSVFRMEENGVDAARQYIAEYFDLETVSKTPVVNSSNKTNFVITPETIDLINSFYARDFELLGYAKIAPGKRARKLSSMSYSSSPNFELTKSNVIRQKLLQDKSAIIEADNARMASELQRDRTDRKLEKEALSIVEEEFRQQSIANAEIARNLEKRLVEIEELFKSSVTRLLGGALSSHETISRSLQESVKVSLETFSDELAGKDQVRSLAVIVKELDKNVLLFRDEASSGSSKLIDNLERLLSERESSYLGIIKNFRESHTADTTEMTVLLQDIREKSSATDAFLEKEISRLQSHLSSSAQSFDDIQKILGQLLAALLQGFDAGSNSAAGFRTEVLAQFSGLAESLTGMDQILGNLGRDVISAIDSSREWMTGRLSDERQFVSSEIANFKQNLSQVKHKLIEAVSESRDMIADCMSIEHDSIEALKDSLISELNSNTAALRQEFEELVRTVDLRDERQESKTLAFEKKLLEQFAALNEIKTKEILELGAKNGELTAQLASAKSSEQLLSNRLDDATVNDAKHRKLLDILTKQVAGLEHEAEEIPVLKQSLMEIQQSETELKNTLDETIDRFHAEIEYRNTLHARNIALEAEIDRLSRNNTALLESTSFRITRPLRAISSSLQTLGLVKRGGEADSVQTLRLTAPPVAAATAEAHTESEFSHYDIAIVVENLDRGGLEQVVLDHARYFTSHCNSLDVFVIYETGQVYQEALKYGINVVCVTKTGMDLDQYLGGKKYDYTFLHHSYGYLHSFRPVTTTMVEVIHNEYSWQLNNEFYDTIRATSIDKFIAVSAPVRQYSIENLSIKETSIVTIANGLNTEGLMRPPVEVMHEYRTSSLRASPTFIMCANGQPQKNHVLVIRAFIRLLGMYPQAKLLLPGNLAVDADVEQEIMNELEVYGNPANIVLPGSLNRRQLSKYLTTAHIALLPTKYEGFSIATLEYLYFGLPMILSNTGGAEYIASKYGSVLMENSISTTDVEPYARQVKSLARNMGRMIEQYPSFIAKSVIAAESYSEYSVEAACREYLNLNN